MPRCISKLPVGKLRALQSSVLQFTITAATCTLHSLGLGGIIHALHTHRQWHWTKAHSNHAASQNHQIIAHVLTIHHEDFIIILQDVRSTESKLPPPELIQLTPNCALDKALGEHAHLIHLQDRRICRIQASFNHRRKYEASYPNH